MGLKTSNLFKLFILLFVILIVTGCPPPPVSKKKAVVILCDVTSSLHETESVKVGELASDVLDRLPKNAEYILYPVQIETEKPPAIERTDPTISLNDDFDVSAEEDPQRRKMIVDKIKELYKNINGKQPKDRTCLLNTLNLSKSFFSDFNDKEYEFELIFVSDMIEQCSNISAIPNQTIDLQIQAPEDALNLLETAQFPDLSNVRLTVIVPGTEIRMTEKSKKQPSLETLKKFWFEIFKKCKNEQAIQSEWSRNSVPLIISQSQAKN